MQLTPIQVSYPPIFTIKQHYIPSQPYYNTKMSWWLPLLGILFLPPLLYMYYHHWYLNQNQQCILLTSIIITIAIIIPSWISIVLILVAYGYHTMYLMEAARCTQMFLRKEGKEYQGWIQRMFGISENQVKLAVYFVYFWIVIRAVSLQSVHYDMGQGETFLTLMHGWNCLLPDLWVINSLWLILTILAALASYFLLYHDRQSQTLYKSYLLTHKILPDLIITTIVVLYHLIIYKNSTSLAQCYQQYTNQGIYFRCLWFWGLPLSTLWFFYRKQGVFQEGGSAKTEGESQMELEMNLVEVNKEYKDYQRKKEMSRERSQ